MTTPTTSAAEAYTGIVTDARAKKSALAAANAALEAAAKDNAAKLNGMGSALALQNLFITTTGTLADLGSQNKAAIARIAKGKAQFTHPGGVAYGKDAAASAAATLAACGDEIEGEETKASTEADAETIQKDFIRGSKVKGTVNPQDLFAFTLDYTEAMAATVKAAVDASTAATQELNRKQLAAQTAADEYLAADALVEPAGRAAYKETRAPKTPPTPAAA